MMMNDSSQQPAMPPGRRHGKAVHGVEKRTVMTRDAHRRLKLAKAAAKAVLAAGGTISAAAAAAQAYGERSGSYCEIPTMA